MNRTVKERICLVEFRCPGELEKAVAEFVEWYNHIHYRERIGSLRLVDVYVGRREEIRAWRKQVKAETLAMRRLANRIQPAVGNEIEIGGSGEVDGDRKRQTPLKKANSVPRYRHYGRPAHLESTACSPRSLRHSIVTQHKALTSQTIEV
jgi:hypothetical protein